MIFFVPTLTILRSVQNMQEKSKLKLRSLLTVQVGMNLIISKSGCVQVGRISDYIEELMCKDGEDV
jgi:hypothetical protein